MNKQLIKKGVKITIGVLILIGIYCFIFIRDNQTFNQPDWSLINKAG